MSFINFDVESTDRETFVSFNDQRLDGYIKVCKGFIQIGALDDEQTSTVKKQLKMACEVRAEKVAKLYSTDKNDYENTVVLASRLRLVIEDFKEGILVTNSDGLGKAFFEALYTDCKHTVRNKKNYIDHMETAFGSAEVHTGSEETMSDGNSMDDDADAASTALAVQGVPHDIVSPSDATGLPYKNGMNVGRICDFVDKDFFEFQKTILDEIRRKQPFLCARVATTGSLEEHVAIIFDALREQRQVDFDFPDATPTDSQCVVNNGDVQKGKTDVALFKILVCHCISKSNDCADQIFTVFVTGMVAWAVDLLSKFMRKVHAEVEVTDEDMDGDDTLPSVDDIDADDDANTRALKNNIISESHNDKNLPCCLVNGEKNWENARQVMRKCGCLIVGRTYQQAERAKRWVNQHCEEKKGDGNIVPWVNVIMDEADMLLGSLNAIEGVVDHTQKDIMSYEAALFFLLGFSYERSEHSVYSWRKSRSNIPFMISFISATNAGTFFFLIQRLCVNHTDYTGEGDKPVINLMDVSSFTEQGIQDGYLSADYRETWNPSEPFQKTMPGNGRVTPQGVAFMGDAFWTNKGCLMTSITSTVNRGKNNNLCDTQQNYNCELLVNAARGVPDSEKRSMPNFPVVQTFIHGGHQTYEGMSGFTVTSRDDPAGGKYFAALATTAYKFSQEFPQHLESIMSEMQAITMKMQNGTATHEDRWRDQQLAVDKNYYTSDARDSLRRAAAELYRKANHAARANPRIATAVQNYMAAIVRCDDFKANNNGNKNTDYEQMRVKAKETLQRLQHRTEWNCSVEIEMLRPLLAYMERQLKARDPHYVFQLPYEYGKRLNTSHIGLMYTFIRWFDDLAAPFLDCFCIDTATANSCHDGDDTEDYDDSSSFASGDNGSDIGSDAGSDDSSGFSDFPFEWSGMTIRELMGSRPSRDIPIAVNGRGMIKRCLSIVAVALGEPLMTITHSFVDSNQDGAAADQLVLRFCTTLTSLGMELGPVKVLWNEKTHEAVDGHTAYNSWSVWKLPYAQRRAILNKLTDACRGEFSELMAGASEEAQDKIKDYLSSSYSLTKNAEAVQPDQQFQQSTLAMAAILDIPKPLLKMCKNHPNALFQSGIGKAAQHSVTVGGCIRHLNKRALGEVDEDDSVYTMAPAATCSNSKKTKTRVDHSDEIARRRSLPKNTVEERAISQCLNELLIPAFDRQARAASQPKTRQSYDNMVLPSETRKNGIPNVLLNWFDPTHTTSSGVKGMFYRIEHFPICYEDMKPGGICYDYIGSAAVGKQSISDGRHYLKWFFRALALENDEDLQLPISIKLDPPAKGVFPAEAYNLRAMIERYMPDGAAAP
jgi:cell division protein ZapA (FtsZ GTPase activity inhibitor)